MSISNKYNYIRTFGPRPIFFPKKGFPSSTLRQTTHYCVSLEDWFMTSVWSRKSHLRFERTLNRNCDCMSKMWNVTTIFFARSKAKSLSTYRDVKLFSFLYWRWFAFRPTNYTHLGKSNCLLIIFSIPHCFVPSCFFPPTILSNKHKEISPCDESKKFSTRFFMLSNEFWKRPCI